MFRIRPHPSGSPTLAHPISPLEGLSCWRSSAVCSSSRDRAANRFQATSFIRSGCRGRPRLLINESLLNIEKSRRGNKGIVKTCSTCLDKVYSSHRMLGFFSSRPNLGPPLSPAGEFDPTLPPVTGRGHSLAERGRGGPNSDKGIYTVVL